MTGTPDNPPKRNFEELFLLSSILKTNIFSSNNICHNIFLTSTAIYSHSVENRDKFFTPKNLKWIEFSEFFSSSNSFEMSLLDSVLEKLCFENLFFWNHNH